MQSVFAKIAAVVIGVLLLLLAVGMLTADSGILQTGRNNALAYIVGLVGLGMIAASFFGDSLKYGGEGDKGGPLGKIVATGGAAVFVIGLIFILTIEDRAPHGEAAAANPTQTVDQTAAPSVQDASETGQPAPVETPLAAPNDPKAAYAEEEPAQFGGLELAAPAAVEPGPIYDPYGAPGQAVPNMSRVRTYCSYCCNGNPIGCGQVGGGIAYSPQGAAAIAFEMCVANDGLPDYCYANLQPF